MPYALLIVKRDSTCSKIVSRLLKACDHQKLQEGKILNCFEAILKIKDNLNPVLFTNVNRLRGVMGTLLLTKITTVFEFDIVQMTPNNYEIDHTRGQPINATAYVVNISSLDRMNSLWELANKSRTKEPRPAADPQACNNCKMPLSTEEGSLSMPSDYTSGTSLPTLSYPTSGLGSRTQTQNPMYSNAPVTVATSESCLPSLSYPMSGHVPVTFETSGTFLPSLSYPTSGHGSKTQTQLYWSGAQQYCPSDGTYGEESSLPQAEAIHVFMNEMRNSASSFWQRGL